MLFNSIDFAIFLPIVFFLYWFVFNKNLQHQNILIVVASYIFYGWWDWRFLSLVLFSTVLDFTLGLQISREPDAIKRRILLWVSLITNLGFLGFFKYFNFFTASFVQAFSLLGTEFNASTMQILLPVGISFYTFQTLSYTIDVYKEKLPATSDFVSFSAFVSFFPQLVAGPIERATNLLPQFYSPRKFDYNKATDGLRQILWGLFKKIVIADNCADHVNAIFNNYVNHAGSTLVFGAFFFAFQIYCDFSGYSDIAIGTSRLFGFDLMRNFAYPYFSRDIAEFWRRWHISLSTWFRDYVYFPIGGSRGSRWISIRNIFVVFVLSGLWHGANWTFVAWGLLNAMYFLPLLILNKNRTNLDIVASGKYMPTLREAGGIVATFVLTMFAWIFFRSPSIDAAFGYVSGIFTTTLLSLPDFGSMSSGYSTLALIGIFVAIEWMGREEEYAIASLGKRWKRPARWAVYYSIVVLIFLFAGKEQQFIYFQF